MSTLCSRYTVHDTGTVGLTVGLPDKAVVSMQPPRRRAVGSSPHLTLLELPT